MRIFFNLFIFFISYFFALVQPFAMENAFYILRGNVLAYNSLVEHARAIQILIPQAYHINAEGNVKGSIDINVLQFAKANNIQLMPLITNAQFDQTQLHQFLTNKTAQMIMLQNLLTISLVNKYDGVQFDFENVSIADRSALSEFYCTAYKLFHTNHLKMSVAVVPATTNQRSTEFLERKHKNWTGAYDLKTIANCSDFITLMSYDQHTQGTTPGPTANISWVNATIQYALQYVPAEKISLGIPTYSNHWYVTELKNKNISVHLDNIDYQLAIKLLNKHRAQIFWDNKNQVHYALYENNWLNEYLFLEDARSFQAKLKLAQHYHLRGVSVFELGFEDNKIWQILESVDNDNSRYKTNNTAPNSHPLLFDIFDILL